MYIIFYNAMYGIIKYKNYVMITDMDPTKILGVGGRLGGSNFGARSWKVIMP